MKSELLDKIHNQVVKRVRTVMKKEVQVAVASGGTAEDMKEGEELFKLFVVKEGRLKFANVFVHGNIDLADPERMDQIIDQFVREMEEVLTSKETKRGKKDE